MTLPTARSFGVRRANDFASGRATVASQTVLSHEGLVRHDGWRQRVQALSGPQILFETAKAVLGKECIAVLENVALPAAACGTDAQSLLMRIGWREAQIGYGNTLKGVTLHALDREVLVRNHGWCTIVGTSRSSCFGA